MWASIITFKGSTHCTCVRLGNLIYSVGSVDGTWFQTIVSIPRQINIFVQQKCNCTQKCNLHVLCLYTQSRPPQAHKHSFQCSYECDFNSDSMNIPRTVLSSVHLHCTSTFWHDVGFTSMQSLAAAAGDDAGAGAVVVVGNFRFAFYSVWYFDLFVSFHFISFDYSISPAKSYARESSISSNL